MIAELKASTLIIQLCTAWATLYLSNCITLLNSTKHNTTFIDPGRLMVAWVDKLSILLYCSKMYYWKTKGFISKANVSKIINIKS